MATAWRITGYRGRETVIEHWVSGSTADKDSRQRGTEQWPLCARSGH